MFLELFFGTTMIFDDFDMLFSRVFRGFEYVLRDFCFNITFSEKNISQVVESVFNSKMSQFGFFSVFESKMFQFFTCFFSKQKITKRCFMLSFKSWYLGNLVFRVINILNAKVLRSQKYDRNC